MSSGLLPKPCTNGWKNDCPPSITIFSVVNATTVFDCIWQSFDTMLLPPDIEDIGAIDRASVVVHGTCAAVPGANKKPTHGNAGAKGIPSIAVSPFRHPLHPKNAGCFFHQEGGCFSEPLSIRRLLSSGFN